MPRQLMLGGLLLATAFIVIGVARGQNSGEPQIINRETQNDSVREITAPEGAMRRSSPISVS